MLRLRLLFSLVVLGLTTLAMQAQDEMTATYIHRALEVTVPYHGVHQAVGHLEVTLLSPEDKVLARSDTAVKASAANGVWEAELTPDHSIPFDDLVWERIRSRVFFEGERTSAMTQIRSVSSILRHPVVHLLGQTHYLAGAPAALRVIVTDGTPNASPVTTGAVHIELLKQNVAPQALFTGKLDHHGSTNAEFRFPSNLTGDAPLSIVTETPLGTAETTETIHLVSAGPDRRFGNEYDLAVIIDLDEGGLFLPGSRSIAMKIEHEHGPFNGLAKVTGSVVDTTGASVPGARITLDALENGAVRHGTSDATGTWTFTGLPPGGYRVTVASTGFVTATRTLTIAARDQAILRATLSVGTVTETVEVTGAAPMALATDAAAFDRVEARAGVGMALRAAPMAQPAFDGSVAKSESAPTTQTEAHTRSYFPEVLFIAPEIITDSHGNATASFPRQRRPCLSD